MGEDVQRLSDKVAIVTGAAQGIGRGIAAALIREGASVALWDVSEAVHKTAQTLRPAGGQTLAHVVDVADAARVLQAAGDIQERFGTVDILVNNAGIAHFAMFTDMDSIQRDRIFKVNIIGAWNCCQAVLPFMIRRHYGRIINIASVTGPRVATAGLTAYAASKGALSAFTRALALETAPHGITVNAILPGFIDTALTKPMADDFGMDAAAFADWLEQSIPVKRLGTVAELGSLAAFLASPESGYITGQEIVIDGGNTIQEVKGMR